ncbi:hypothetical protein EBU99_02155 [bacterium]|nr:hypothetical protein [bacterium]
MKTWTSTLFLVPFACLALLSGCASTDSQSATTAAKASDESGEDAKPAARSAKKTEAAKNERAQTPAPNKGQTFSQSAVVFTTTTLSNEESFSGQIPQAKLEDVLRDLEQVYRDHNDDGGSLISYLVFRRLSGTSRDFLSVLEKRGSTASSRDPWILIECAYTALLRRDFGMMQYLLDSAETVGKGKEKVNAAVLHARGLMFFTEKKTVLAMAAFREAAKLNYEPAILTLAFFALKAGDHEGALGQLNKLKDSSTGNLNVKAALGIAYRQSGKTEEALDYLRAVQRARPSDRRALWNLALALSEIPAKRNEAISLLEKYNDAPGSLVDFDSKARNLLSKLQSQEEAAKAENAKQKAAGSGEKTEDAAGRASSN